MENKQKAELLAPSGNFDCVKAAVNAGADAVYLGGRAFGARAYAANFDNEELERVCDLCHSFGVKIYVTVNTLYKDEEFPELYSFINILYTMGVDGLIMQDLGAIRMVRQTWPDLPVHASTQLTANSLDDVKLYEEMGLKTVVLSRELNLTEIKHIASSTNIRIETFIHGALCVSYSGQCLMSSVLGNRSGNRGKCSQNCRLCYELLQGKQVVTDGHLLSTKDICTLTLLPELLTTGVASLKIEGRMKSPEYVAGVTGIYRKYLDLYYSGKPYRVDPKDILILQQLFNRGAFSNGYLKTHSGLEMMCPTHPKHWGVNAGKVLAYDRKKQTAAIRFEKDMIPGDGIEIRTDNEEGVGTYLNKAVSAGQKSLIGIRGDIRENQAVYQTYDKRLMDSLKPRYEVISRKVPLEAFISIHVGKTAELTLTSSGMTVTVQGDVPTPAQNQPLTAETVSAQISKLGNTIYTCENISVDLEDGLYLNKSSLNSIKNNAAELLRNQTILAAKRIAKNTILQGKSKDYAEAKSLDDAHGGRHACTGFAAQDACPHVLSSEQRKHTWETVNFTLNSSHFTLLSVCVRTTEQFRAALESGLVSMIYAEMNNGLMVNIEEMCQKAHSTGKKIAVKLPRIWREYIRQNHAEELKKCMSSEIDGFLISNPGHYYAVKNSGKELFLDFTANVLNSQTVAFWKTLGLNSIALSVEMSRDEINALPDQSCTELLAYGYIPLMVTHQCPVGNFASGKKDSIHCGKFGHRESYTLRSGKDSFRLETDCRDCICTITTQQPIDIRDDIHSFNVKTFRLNFYDESYENTSRIFKIYENIINNTSHSVSPNENIYDKQIL